MGFLLRKLLLVMVNVLFMLSKSRKIASAASSVSAFVSTSTRRKINTISQTPAFQLNDRSFPIYNSRNALQTARFLSSETNDESETPKKSKPKSKKIQVKEITPEKLEKLAALFDEMAIKDGFDPSLARHADDETFEDFFDDDDDFLDDDDEGDDEGDDGAAIPSPVPQTGQTGCWDASGSPIGCAGTGQDGEYQYGVSVDPRLTDNGDGTVSDKLTGLIWLKWGTCGLGGWEAA